MARPKPDDELFKRPGRLKDFGEEEVSRIFFSRPWFRQGSTTGINNIAIIDRARTASGSDPYVGFKQVVVKSLSPRYGLGESKATLRYISRQRNEDIRSGADTTVQLFDGFGDPLPHKIAAKKLAKWSALNSKGKVHSWHIVLSLQTDGAEGADRRFNVACRKTIDEAFMENGFECYWAAHQDKPGRSHAHILLNAQGIHNRKWRFDMHGDVLDSLRSIFAKYSRMSGFKVCASRREDRPLLREKIAWGEEPLRTSRSRTNWSKGCGRPEVRTPHWFQTYGRQIDKADAKPSIFRIALQVLTKTEAKPARRSRAEELFAAVYPEPERAIESFIALAQESATNRYQQRIPISGFALWHLKHCPALFGSVKEDRALEEKLDLLIRHIKPIQIPSATILLVSIKQDSASWWRRTKRNQKAMRACLMRLADLDEMEHGNSVRAKKIRSEAARLEQIVLPDVPPPLPPAQTRNESPPLARPRPPTAPPPASDGSDPTPITVRPPDNPTSSRVTKTQAKRHRRNQDIER